MPTTLNVHQRGQQQEDVVFLSLSLFPSFLPPFLPAGGEGGALNSQYALLAVINTTFVGLKGDSESTHPLSSGSDSEAAAVRRAAYSHITMSAYIGGCLSLEASVLLVAGSSFSHCNARFVGGAISTLAVMTVLRDSNFSNSYADMVSVKFWPELLLLCRSHFRV